jgi:hypothetical protein
MDFSGNFQNRIEEGIVPHFLGYHYWGGDGGGIPTDYSFSFIYHSEIHSSR